MVNPADMSNTIPNEKVRPEPEPQTWFGSYRLQWAGNVWRNDQMISLFLFNYPKEFLNSDLYLKLLYELFVKPHHDRFRQINCEKIRFLHELMLSSQEMHQNQPIRFWKGGKSSTLFSVPNICSNKLFSLQKHISYFLLTEDSFVQAMASIKPLLRCHGVPAGCDVIRVVSLRPPPGPADRNQSGSAHTGRMEETQTEERPSALPGSFLLLIIIYFHFLSAFELWDVCFYTSPAICQEIAAACVFTTLFSHLYDCH